MGMIDNILAYILCFPLILLILLDIGFKQVLCLSNSTIVVDFIQKGLNVHHKYKNLIMAIKHVLRRDLVVSLRHILHEDTLQLISWLKKGVLNFSSLVILDESSS